jgi:hypothetical protein
VACRDPAVILSRHVRRDPTPRSRPSRRHRQQDAHLAGIRDAAALAKLPAAEQNSFTHFWANVAQLLKKAEETAN